MSLHKIVLFLIFQDILQNEEIKLDWMFRCSLATDLANVRVGVNSSLAL